MSTFRFLSWFTCLFMVVSVACKKESFTTDPTALLIVSQDTLRFDTVFTTTGSVTRSIRLSNPNDQSIRIQSIRVSGGNRSFFRMNADGIEAQEVNDLTIRAGDSLHVFFTVSIDPSAELLPFLVQDSIRVSFNNQEKQVQLEAYGQNAVFLRNQVIRTDAVFTRRLPYVVLGGLRVDTGALLRIEKGARIYCHGDAPLIVDGSLVAEGTKEDSIVFRSDRLDPEYRDLPAGWPGIYFRSSSKNNRLTYTYILNAYQGLVADQPAANSQPKLTLSSCVVDNCYEAGILAIRSSVSAVNCQVSNCGSNILLLQGGVYDFTHCTAAAYSQPFLLHKNPVLLVTNWDSTSGQLLTYDLEARFTNNVFWGDLGSVDNEVQLSRKGPNLFEVRFDHNLYKVTQPPGDAQLNNNLLNLDPLFDSVNTAAGIFDFRILRKPSPCVDKGLPTGVALDLDGRARDARPDIGCFEKK